MANEATVRNDDEEQLVQELKDTRARANPNMNPKIAKGEMTGQPAQPAPPPPITPEQSKKMTIRDHLEALFNHFGYK